MITPSFLILCAIQKLGSKAIDKAALNPICLVSFSRTLSRPDVALWQPVKFGYRDPPDCPMLLINRRAYLDYRVHHLTK